MLQLSHKLFWLVMEIGAELEDCSAFNDLLPMIREKDRLCYSVE